MPKLLGMLFCMVVGLGCQGDTKPAGEVTRIVITPGAVLLTGDGQSTRLSALAYDAEAAPVAAKVQWRSADPAIATVSSSGEVTTKVELGSVQIFAELGTIRSAPVLLLIATPSQGALLIDDKYVVEGPISVDEGAEYGLGYQMQYTLQDLPALPIEGQILLGTGQSALGGRVVRVTPEAANTTVILELVPLKELFDALEVSESVLLDSSSMEIPARVGTYYTVYHQDDGEVVFTPRPVPLVSARASDHFEGTRAVGPFECGVSGQVQLNLAVAPTVRLTPHLTFDLQVHEREIERLVVHGDLESRFGIKPRISGAYEGKMECKMGLFFLRLPFGGPLSLLVGGQVPVGVGFELSGKATIASIGVDLSTEITVAAAVGLDCTGLECQSITDVDLAATAELDWAIPNPLNDFRFEPTMAAFISLELKIGSPWLRSLQFEFVKSKGGVKFTGNLSGKQAQLSDAAYASDYKVVGFFDVGAGTAIMAAQEALQLSLTNPFQLKLEYPIFQSPAGTLTATPSLAIPGAEVDFRVRLDPDRLSFFGIDNVQSVDIYEVDGENLELVKTLPSTAGQTEFEWTWVPGLTDLGSSAFVAFVVPSILSFAPLEVSKDSKRSVLVGDDPPLAFTSLRTGENEIFAAAVNGSALTNLTNLPDSIERQPLVWSPDHQKLAFGCVRDNGSDICSVDADGSNLMRLTDFEGPDGSPSWSPDGTKIVYNRYATGDYDFEIYVMDADGTNKMALTNTPGFANRNPKWSPDGTQIVFVSERDGVHDVYVMNFDGTDQTKLTNSSFHAWDPLWSPDSTMISYWTEEDTALHLIDSSGQNHRSIANAAGAQWSPDGTRLLFGRAVNSNVDVYMMDVDGSNLTRLTTNTGVDGGAVWSPSGEYIAFVSNRDGNYEIYTIKVDGSELTNVSNDDARDGTPSW